MLRDQIVLLVVLLVEDSDLQREVARSLLEEMGFGRVIVARDGVEALQQLEKGKVDFILSDWEMPEMDGLELLKNVRAKEDYKNTPFIILTVVDQKERIVNAMQAGVTDYIIKPVEKNILKDKLKKIFETE